MLNKLGDDFEQNVVVVNVVLSARFYIECSHKSEYEQMHWPYTALKILNS